MWSPDLLAWRALRIATVLGLAGLVGGCFQPMYGSHTAYSGGESIVEAMRSVQVPEVKTTPGQLRLPRVSVQVRNDVIFALTGGAATNAPTHRLDINLSSQQLQVIVDINSGRPDIQNYGIDATYSLVDLATGKTVITGVTFSRVSFNIPGQQQRFAGERGLRDAENRAALVIAENIRNRLASYFTAGT
jgi:LPS-assembly lipoprotein